MLTNILIENSVAFQGGEEGEDHDDCKKSVAFQGGEEEDLLEVWPPHKDDPKYDKHIKMLKIVSVCSTF